MAAVKPDPSGQVLGLATTTNNKQQTTTKKTHDPNTHTQNHEEEERGEEIVFCELQIQGCEIDCVVGKSTDALLVQLKMQDPPNRCECQGPSLNVIHIDSCKDKVSLKIVSKNT
jgi:hypothetical protein